MKSGVWGEKRCLGAKSGVWGGGKGVFGVYIFFVNKSPWEGQSRSRVSRRVQFDKNNLTPSPIQRYIAPKIQVYYSTFKFTIQHSSLLFNIQVYYSKFMFTILIYIDGNHKLIIKFTKLLNVFKLLNIIIVIIKMYLSYLQIQPVVLFND